MTVQEHRIARWIAGGILRGHPGGMWYAIRAWAEGRNAVEFERERRSTLLAVPASLHRGGRVYDRRANGSVLEITVPALEPRNVVLRESVQQRGVDMVPTALPPSCHAGFRDIQEQ